MIERIAITSREQWLELRKSDVTASVIGALFGVHPWQTIAGLHAEKMGIELPGPDPESSTIRRGNELEDFVGAKVAKLRPEWKIIKNTDYLRDAHARLGATLDFLIEGDSRGLGALQVKTTNPRDFKKSWLCDGDEPVPPTWILLQLTTEMMLADAAFGAVAVQVVGDFAWETHIVEVPRNKRAEHKLRVAVHSFWQALDNGQTPTLDYARDSDLIALMYPREVESKVIDLAGDNRAAFLCAERERQAGIIKEAETAKAALDTELKEKIGDAEVALIGGWRCTFRTTHRKERVVPATSFRVLRTIRKDA